MKTLLASAALALALTAGGGAFAAPTASEIDLSLYEETNAFVVVKGPAFTEAGYVQTADRSGQRHGGAPVGGHEVTASDNPFYAE